MYFNFNIIIISLFKVERIENKVIQPITKYDEYLKTCKVNNLYLNKIWSFWIIIWIKNTIKSAITVRDKEKQKQQKLNTVMQKNPDNGRNIVKLWCIF
jgi:hypothetical protein